MDEPVTDTDEREHAELAAVVSKLDQRLKNQSRQLASMGLSPNMGGMAMARVNLLVDAVFGPMTPDPVDASPGRLAFEHLWLTAFVESNAEALLNPPTQNGTASGLVIP